MLLIFLGVTTVLSNGAAKQGSECIFDLTGCRLDRGRRPARSRWPSAVTGDQCADGSGDVQEERGQVHFLDAVEHGGNEVRFTSPNLYSSLGRSVTTLDERIRS